MATADRGSAAESKCMGDKSPKNIHKQVDQRHDKEVEKVQHKHENAEAQHHPVSGHPPTPEETEKLEKEAVAEPVPAR
jgi:hypothetical protein